MSRIIILISMLFCVSGFAQTEKDVWENTDTVSTEIYEFQVPTTWRNFKKLLSDRTGPEQFFEASDQGLPISFNNGPVKVSIFLVNLGNKKLKVAKKNTITGYFKNPDRVFRKKKDYDEASFKLSDGDKAAILNTRFFRKSKELNQSRYDLVTYSKKHKTAYMLTVSIQYLDKTYSFEKDHNLEAYAKKLFSTFKWK